MAGRRRVALGGHGPEDTEEGRSGKSLCAVEAVRNTTAEVEWERAKAAREGLAVEGLQEEDRRELDCAGLVCQTRAMPHKWASCQVISVNNEGLRSQ